MEETSETSAEEVKKVIAETGEEVTEEVPDFPLYSSVGFRHWQLTQPRRDSYQNTNIYWRVSPTQAVRFFGPNEAPAEIVFSVEQRSFAPKPDAIRTAEPAGETSSNVLGMCFRLNNEQHNWFCAFDEHLQKLITEHSFIWFSRTMSATEVERDYRSAVVPGVAPYAAFVKINLILSGRDTTNFVIHGPDGQKRAEGNGAAFIESVQGPNKWKGDRVRVVLCPHKLQYRNRLIYVTFRATHVQILEVPDRSQVDPFSL